ncbi:MAG: hypothetical protein GY906_22510 [bacterium]|nr:hypothetical protein [bacterium]
MNPYKPFPAKTYLRTILNYLDRCPLKVKLIPKSRTMMCSWSVSAWTAHFGFNHAGTSTIFQSADEERAIHDVRYVKEMWKNSLPELKARWPVDKDPDRQPEHEFTLRNRARWLALTGNPAKIRSEHPTIYVCDEAAHYDEFDQAYNTAVGCDCLHIIALSSPNPGPFADMDMSAVPTSWPEEYDAEDEQDEELRQLMGLDEVECLI